MPTTEKGLADSVTAGGAGSAAYEGPPFNLGGAAGVGVSYMQSFDVGAPGPRAGIPGQPTENVTGWVLSWGPGWSPKALAGVGVYSSYAHSVLYTDVPPWLLIPCRAIGACGGS